MKAKQSSTTRGRAKAPKAARRTAFKIPRPPPSRTRRGAPPPRISRAPLFRSKHPVKPVPSKPATPRKPARQRVRICKQEDCNLPQTTQGFCRLHYLANWRSLKEEKAKRAQKNLDRYVERMAGAKKPNPEEEEQSERKDEAVFEEDFGEFVDVLSREENLDKILNGIKVEDY